MLRGVVVLSCAALCLAACGGAAKPKAATTATTCVSPQATAKLDADLTAIRRAAAKPTKNTLLGSAVINRATDRFLRDVELAHISNLERNRMIDHAAGSLAGTCEQCFQALEASRPVENIRRGSTC